MTYVIAEPCIDEKDKSCIDCGSFEPECPVEAIFLEDALPEQWAPFTKINAAILNGGIPAVNAAFAEHRNGNGGG